jgi:Ca2+:H+ antiporter
VIFSHTGTSSDLAFSRYTSCLLLLVYALFLYFQLVTHTDVFEEKVEGGEEEQEEEEEEEEITQTFGGCVLWLAVVTVFIAVFSNNLVGAIEVRWYTTRSSGDCFQGGGAASHISLR